MTPKVDKIIVRMYRIGTGDCFVLKFLSGEQETFNMMIDCGACQGDGARFSSFVNKIKDYVDGHLDLLVVTHEHLDHIIGFKRAKEAFQQFEIDNVWVAWTEDPSNDLADTLKKKYGKDVQSLALAVQKIETKLNDPNYKEAVEEGRRGTFTLRAQKRFLTGLKDSLELYAQAKEFNLLAAEGRSNEMKQAMNFVLKDIALKTGQSPHYCYPGMAVPKLKGTTGIRFFVLGPPENEALLKKEEIKDEVYERKFTDTTDQSFITALTSSCPADDDAAPFSDKYYLTDTERTTYEDNYLIKNPWRRIDTDWLYNAGSLAIRLEKYINNTSLVLAIQFEDSERVLLFPADAQSGNWKSWHASNLKWTVKKNGEKKQITAKDLLENTVFYKAGHHCSHNGTASKSGLDLINHEDLMAMLPLDYGNIKPGWKSTMPGKGFNKELIRKTKGRLFRIDKGLVSEKAAITEREKLSRAETKKFENAYKVENDFIELTIEG
jgi:hypothetical protein